jgi:hypothetical protein
MAIPGWKPLGISRTVTKSEDGWSKSGSDWYDPSDMLDICRVISEQLEALNLQ